MLRPLLVAMQKLLAIILLMFFQSVVLARGNDLEPTDFLHQAFSGKPPEPGVIWISKAIRQKIEIILDHNYRGLRIRYWYKTNRSAWILEEIGKEEPITTGLVVGENGLESIRVLVYRESRGWEVKHSFFTQQFIGARLDGKNNLDRRINGITGATLSVRALTKLARIALYLHQIIQQKNE